MPNVVLFHCPNCDNIEPIKFHRKPNQLDGHSLLVSHGSVSVCCNNCKFEESLSWNHTKIPETLSDPRD